MDARKALSKVQWRWDEGRWFDLGNLLFFSFAESFWLLWGLSNWEDGSSDLLIFDWEESSWCRFVKGVGWKGILICLGSKDANWVLPLVVKVFVLPYFDFLGEKGWVGVVPRGCWVKGAKLSWDCHMKWTFGSPSHSLKCSICHSGFHR